MCRLWLTWLLKRKQGVLTWVAAMKTFHSPTQLCGHPHVHVPLPFTSFVTTAFGSTDSAVHNTTRNTSFFFFLLFLSTVSTKTISTTNPKEHSDDICGEAGQPALFTCRPCVDVKVLAPCCVQQEEGCGAYKRGSTGSNLLFTLWPTCMFLPYDSWLVYVASVRVSVGPSNSNRGGGRNRNRNCSRLNVSTETTKGISLCQRSSKTELFHLT